MKNQVKRIRRIVSGRQVAGGPSFTVALALAILLSFILRPGTLHAQQLPVYTQFMFSSYVFNPAVTGTNNYFQARLNSRFQWVGINEAPRTNILSIYGPLSSKDMGVGGYIFNDVTGPTSRNGIYGSYAYNLMVNQDMRLSMGLSAGLIQHRVDGSRITLLDPSDQAILNTMSSDISPDASVGFYLYGPDFHVGLSAHQLFGNTLNLFDKQRGFNKLKTHFYLTGGYRYAIDFDYAVEPSVVIRASSPSPMQVEFCMKGYYQNMLWLGISVRTQDAVSVLVGYTHENRFNFGYSYDMSFSPIRHHNSGSHEIYLGMRFNPVRR